VIRHPTISLVLSLSAAALGLGGCDSRSPTAREGYDERPAISGTAFPQDETSLGDPMIQRLLDGRVAIPTQAMIAVLPMDCGDGSASNFHLMEGLGLLRSSA